MIKTVGGKLIYRIVNCAVVRGTRNIPIIYKTYFAMARSTRNNFQIIILRRRGSWHTKHIYFL